MTNELAKIAEKVRKLLALAENSGATEAEAALAAERAQEIMADHNLTMAAVEAAGGQSEGGVREKAQEKGQAMYKWQRDLMYTICDTNYVHLLSNWRGSRATGYVLIGRAANVAAARHLFSYLTHTINRLCREEFGPVRSREAHSFSEGCTDRLRQRIRHRHEEVVERKSREARQGQTANALVILDDYEQQERDLNRDLYRGMAPGTTARERAESDARLAAREAARSAEVERLVAEGTPREVAEYMASGFSRETAEKLCAPKRPETEAQQRARRAKEDRQQERWRHQQWNKHRNRDWRAYQQGQAAGDSIGLDTQVDRSKHTKLI